eukprot:GHVU01086024.1.p1 GENE.GHVU01086024.1~~GHVU01086024.1.p1  ORF type:complete len:376 (-),score=21.02 GHVU01086024.1:98-1105(-)
MGDQQQPRNYSDLNNLQEQIFGVRDNANIVNSDDRPRAIERRALFVDEIADIFIAPPAMRNNRGGRPKAENMYKRALTSFEELFNGGSLRPMEYFTLRDRVPCRFGCGARLWQFELTRHTTCCFKGEIDASHIPIPSLPDELDPAHLIYAYWWGNQPGATFFQRNARKLNSHFSFRSAIIRERTGHLRGNYPGYFTIRGEIVHMQPTLVAPPGQAPRQCQLYVVDPDHTGMDSVTRQQQLLEAEQLATMYFRTARGFSEAEKRRLIQIGSEIFRRLRICNPFLRDYQAIMEMPLDERRNSTFVICGDPNRVRASPPRPAKWPAKLTFGGPYGGPG